MEEKTLNYLKQQFAELKTLSLLGSKSVLSVTELSQYLGLSKSRIYALICKRRIPYYKNDGGKLTFFNRAEIDQWLLAKRVPTADEIEQKAVSYCLAHSKKGGSK